MEEKAGSSRAVGEEQSDLSVEGEQEHDGIAELKRTSKSLQQFHLYHKMYQYVPKKGCTGKMIFDDLYAMRQGLKALGKHIEDSEFNAIVLGNLPPRFEDWKIVTRPKDRTSDYLRESLILYDLEQQLRRERDLMAKEYQNQNSKCFACGK